MVMTEARRVIKVKQTNIQG